MGAKSAIEWTDSSWNPVSGCTKLSPASPGCANCYAETVAERFRGGKAYPNGFDVTLRPHKLDEPLRWTRPRRVFVNSMSDLFHANITDEYIAQVFAVMAAGRRHIFQVLTKRHARMRSLLSSPHFTALVEAAYLDLPERHRAGPVEWPIPNLWLGVSAENQQWADRRIPALLATPAAIRFVSAEPLLGPIRLTAWHRCPEHGQHCPGGHDGVTSLDWLIAGGESGPGARPMHPNWARLLRDDCADAGIPFLFKQWGSWAPAPWAGEGGATHAFTGGHLKDGTAHFAELEQHPTSGERTSQAPPGAQGMTRRPKAAAGRELDGRLWDGYPAAWAGTPQ